MVSGHLYLFLYLEYKKQSKNAHPIGKKLNVGAPPHKNMNLHQSDEERLSSKRHLWWEHK